MTLDLKPIFWQTIQVLAGKTPLEEVSHYGTSVGLRSVTAQAHLFCLFSASRVWMHGGHLPLQTYPGHDGLYPQTGSKSKLFFFKVLPVAILL